MADAVKRLHPLALAAMLAVVACSSPGSAVPTTGPALSTTTTSAPATTTTAGAPTSTSSPTTGAPTTTAANLPLAERVIVIDPGHNGRNYEHLDEISRLVDIGNGTKACNTTGTQAADGYPEATFTWELAMVARSTLQELGAEVVLTRPDNDGWGPCIDQRAAIGNDAAADAVVSIHADGGPSRGRGFHIIYPPSVAGLTDDIADASLTLARMLLESFATTGMPIEDYLGVNGLSERSDLGGLNLSDVPVVFLEAGNMKNATDLALLKDDDFLSAAAKAIAAALVEFLA